MKNLVYIVTIVFISILFGCKSSTKPVSQNTETNQKFSDTVRIANDDTGYEIIIIDGGFNPWLHSTARPRGFYTQSHLESRNIPWVIEWNNRARSPRSSRDVQLFPMQIDYQNGTDYGYEVNYMLYNYLVYFQLQNNIRLGGFAPRP
nr:DUF6146 family protein [uncultured Flavobacterium sp.]